jgi:hypothetical protein
LNHYIYVYCDPRKPGRYQYGDLEFSYEPFYVGKGKGDRWKPCMHTTIDNGHNNIQLVNKIKKIGIRDVITLKPITNILEKDALNQEKIYIKSIGRKDLKNGPLLNMTDGGDGPVGYRHSEETKRIMKLKKIGNIPWNKGKKGCQKGRILSEEDKKNISIKNSGCKNGMAVLNKKQVLEIRNLYKSGIKNKDISKEFNISYGVIYSVTSNRKYKNI